VPEAPGTNRGSARPSKCHCWPGFWLTRRPTECSECQQRVLLCPASLQAFEVVEQTQSVRQSPALTPACNGLIANAYVWGTLSGPVSSFHLPARSCRFSWPPAGWHWVPVTEQWCGSNGDEKPAMLALCRGRSTRGALSRCPELPVPTEEHRETGTCHSPIQAALLPSPVAPTVFDIGPWRGAAAQLVQEGSCTTAPSACTTVLQPLRGLYQRPSVLLCAQNAGALGGGGVPSVTPLSAWSVLTPLVYPGCAAASHQRRPGPCVDAGGALGRSAWQQR